MIPRGRFSLLLVISLLIFLHRASSQESLLGFTPASAARQLKLEQKFKAISKPAEERQPAPHLYRRAASAGSKRNNDLARYVAREWRKQGLEGVVIRHYDVYATQPRSASLRHYVCEGDWNLIGSLAATGDVRMVAGGGFEPPTFGL